MERVLKKKYFLSSYVSKEYHSLEEASVGTLFQVIMSINRFANFSIITDDVIFSPSFSISSSTLSMIR